MDELEVCLKESAWARRRLIATDGVFSMDGYLAHLDRICDLAERYDAIVMVDDSHAVGVIGPGGRGTPEHWDVIERVDILTGTLGKAVGGASGGYVSGRREIVELLRQQARPYLFSNSLAPPVVAASLAALELIEGSAELRDHLHVNTARFRARMIQLGFEVLPGEHPIVPVMIGDEVSAGRLRRQTGRTGRLRGQLLLPRRAARHGSHPDPDVRGPHTRRSRLRRRLLRRSKGDPQRGVTSPPMRTPHIMCLNRPAPVSSAARDKSPR